MFGRSGRALRVQKLEELRNAANFSAVICEVTLAHRASRHHPRYPMWYGTAYGPAMYDLLVNWWRAATRENVAIRTRSTGNRADGVRDERCAAHRCRDDAFPRFVGTGSGGEFFFSISSSRCGVRRMAMCT